MQYPLNPFELVILFFRMNYKKAVDDDDDDGCYMYLVEQQVQLVVFF